MARINRFKNNLIAWWNIKLYRLIKKFVAKHRLEMFIHQEMEKAMSEYKVLIDTKQKEWSITFPGTSYFFGLFTQETIKTFIDSGARNFLAYEIRHKSGHGYDVIIQKVPGRTTSEILGILREQLKKNNIVPEA